MTTTEPAPPDVRATMIQLASQAVGWGDNPDTRESYLDLLAGDGESESTRRGMLAMSSCGLVVRGLWRWFFSDEPRGYVTQKSVDARLVAPYAIGSVIATIENMAREASAWRATEEISGGEYEPRPGDVAMVDHVSTHVATLTSVANGYPCTWESVDGGQRDSFGRECIKARRRVVRIDGRGRVVTVADDGLSPATPRELLGVVDLEALAAHFMTVSL